VLLLELHSSWPLGLLRLLPFFVALDEKQTPLFGGKQKPLRFSLPYPSSGCSSYTPYLGRTTALPSVPILGFFSRPYTTLVGILVYRRNPQSVVPTPCLVPIGPASLGSLALHTLVGGSVPGGVRTHMSLLLPVLSRSA
jgi:hypothetical protein